MGQFTQNGVVYEELPDGNVKVVGYASAAPAQSGLPAGAVQLAGPDPAKAYAPQAAALGIQRDQMGLMRDRAALATAPYDARKAAAEASRAEIEANKAAREAAQTSQGAALTPAARLEALSGFKAAEGLSRSVADIRARFAEGPGSTSGIGGLQDYLPTTANQRFDNAGNSARGYVGSALGFTGGQLNTASEASAAVGPYLPQAGDRDDVIRDKISRLEALSGDARQRAIAQLGGIPDANGRIQPVGATMPAVAALAPSAAGNATPPSAPGGGSGPIPYDPSGRGPNLGLTRGSTSTYQDPAKAGVAARVDQMLRSGAPDKEIQSYAAQVGADPSSVSAALDFRRKNPTYRGGYDTKDLELTNAPMSGFRQAMNLAGQYPLGSAVVASADAFSAGTLDNLTENPALARAGLAGLRAQNPKSSLAGTIFGGVAAAGGIEAGLGALGARAGAGLAGRALFSPLTADAVFGAATGAGTADEGSRLLGAVTGGGAGVAGGMFGRGLARGAGRALRGVENADVQYLRSQGVPLTVGQTLGQSGKLGGVIQRTEERVAGLPGVGDMVRGRYDEGLDGLNLAAFNQGASPVGGNITEIGQGGMRQMGATSNRAYTDATAGVSVSPDAQFGSEFGQAYTQGVNVPGLGDQVDYLAQNKLAPIIGSGQMTGDAYQDALRLLRKNQNGYGKMDASGVNPLAGDVVDSLGGMEDALTGLMGRAAPGVAQKLGQANATYRNKKVLEAAVLAAERQGGRFTPNGLARASINNTRKFGGAAAAAEGNRPFAELTNAAQRVMGERVPDSGTAGRLATLGGLGGLGALGGGAGYAAGDAQGGAAGALGVGGLLALAGTKAGQRYLVSALADRPEALKALGITIGSGKAKRALGMFGASAGAAALPRP